jgi:riboflavin synthase
VFTGLVETTGVLAERAPKGPGARLVVRGSLAGEPLALGESITVDGTCLSVVEVLPDGFAVDATAETLARTTLGTLALGRRVNLERALRAGDRLGGHLVTGHVDATGRLLERRAVGDAVSMAFSIPGPIAHFVAEKGSIAVGGVSLTVNAVRDDISPGEASFDVMIIPITLEVTSLADLGPGDAVNLEVDLVARYVARSIRP